MKKLTIASLVFLLMALLAFPSIGQAGTAGQAPCPDFFWQNPLPQGDWTVIAAADGNTAWAASLGGLILKSSDGGQTWVYQWSPAQGAKDTPPLRAISVVNSNVAWICGDDGLVLVTTDGGANWAVRSVPDQVRIQGVSALSGTVAWVDGESGCVYQTADGGLTWNSRPLPSPGGDLYAVSALSEQNAWVSGDNSTVAMTTDGGINWNEMNPSGPGSSINQIKAFSNSNVYATGDSQGFYSTTDGGTSWNLKEMGDNITLFGMSFVDGQDGWVSGTNDFGAGFVAVTGDGGANWTPKNQSQILSERNMTGISAAGNAVWASSTDGSLFRSTDGGNRWDRYGTTWTRDTLTSTSAVDERSAWACGQGGEIIRTFNGGKTWISQQSTVSANLSSIDAVDSSTVWAVGENGTIVKTTDYGSTWAVQTSGTSIDLFSVSAAGENEVWAGGYDDDGAVVLHTTDGGNRWTTVKTIDNAEVASIESRGHGVAWFGAANGPDSAIYKTTNGGSSWHKAPVASPYPLQKVSSIKGLRFVSASEGLAIVKTVRTLDNFTYIFKTTDGGNTWKSLTSEHVLADGDMFSLATVDGETIWSCGASPVPYEEPTTVFKSVNGGANWSSGKDFHRTVLFGMDNSPTGSAMWTVGYVGDILRSTTPSVFSVSPDMGNNTGNVRVSIDGSGFWDGMRVSLVNGSTVIRASSVSVISPYEATCVFNLNGVREGTYDVVTRNTNGMTGTLPDGFDVTSPNTWYLPEGSTAISSAGRFENWVLVNNPNNKSARVDFTYMTPSGEVTGPKFTMPANSRETINVADTVPNQASVSTKVTSDSPIAVERSMYWDTPQKDRQAAHGSIGVNYLSRDWYIAEGSTGSGARGAFETWVLVQNPGSEKANVSVSYLTPTGRVAGPSLVLEPGTRKTVNVADTLPNEYSVSTVVNSDVPVAAERATYWDAPGEFRRAAHDSVGAPNPADEWYMAEGCTGADSNGSFETWITIENPYEQTATAQISYQVPGGQVQGPQVVLPPFTRRTVNVADTLPNEWNVSSAVVADGPVVAERVTYYSTAAFRQADHGSIGSLSPYTTWQVPEGSTGSDSSGGFETWILVQNPGAIAANVSLKYNTPGGQVNGPSFKLKANSRRSISVSDTVANTWSVSTKVQSDRPVVVDSSLYWNAVTQSKRSALSSRGYAPY